MHILGLDTNDYTLGATWTRGLVTAAQVRQIVQDCGTIRQSDPDALIVVAIHHAPDALSFRRHGFQALPGRWGLARLDMELRNWHGEGGTVTAGNASSINDGGAALVVASEQACSRGRLKPLARIVGAGTFS